MFYYLSALGPLCDSITLQSVPGSFNTRSVSLYIINTVFCDRRMIKRWFRLHMGTIGNVFYCSLFPPDVAHDYNMNERIPKMVCFAILQTA